MASWQDVRRLATALPGVTELDDQRPKWLVGKQMFAWTRPLRKADLAWLGLDAQPGPVLGLKTTDLDEKDAVLARCPAAFVTPHFQGYPAVLVWLDEADEEDLEELLTDAWLAKAPKRLAKEFLQRG